MGLVKDQCIMYLRVGIKATISAHVIWHNRSLMFLLQWNIAEMTEMIEGCASVTRSVNLGSRVISHDFLYIYPLCGYPYITP
jgi:hypothetical protein